MLCFILALGLCTSALSEDNVNISQLLTPHFRNLPIINKEGGQIKQVLIEHLQNISNETPGTFMLRQSFSSKIYSNYFARNVEGENLILEFRGRHWNTSRDRIIVIGAHTQNHGLGLDADDNISGIVTILRLSKLLEIFINTGKANMIYTTIFVVFDLHIDLDDVHTVPPGSKVFIEEYLVPMLKTEYPPPLFHGAIILESVLRCNTSENSQRLPLNFYQMFPEAESHIRTNNFRGDFLAVLMRKESLGRVSLADDLEKFWSSRPRLLLLEMEENNSIPSERFYKFLRGDQLSFWNYESEKGKYSPLEAILLTDMGNWRDGPFCPQSCSTAVLTNDTSAFLDEVGVMLGQFIIDKQTTTLNLNDPLEASMATSTVNDAVLKATFVLFSISPILINLY